MPDALTMLNDDHQRVEKLFKEYEDTTDRTVETRRRRLDETEQALTLVPTRPHPGAQDEPPADAAVGLVTGLVDRIRSRVGV